MKITEAKGILLCPIDQNHGHRCTADACCWWRVYTKEKGDCIIKDAAWNIERIADSLENITNTMRSR